MGGWAGWRGSATQRVKDNSASEPSAIPAKRASSRSPLRAHPSARFAHADTAARLSWSVIPNRSAWGKAASRGIMNKVSA